MTSWSTKAVKELYGKKTGKEEKIPRYLLYFDFISGFYCSASKTHPPNDEYENFVSAHFEAAAECILTKQRDKSRVPCVIITVRKKRADVKTASKCYRKNPTNIKAVKLKKAQNEFANIYLKEQTEHIQNQINKIKDSVKIDNLG